MRIKSIQVVTKLNGDVASVTASQGINFWLSLERALEGIEAQLRSEEVGMVMDCLRNEKRFHAVMAGFTKGLGAGIGVEVGGMDIEVVKRIEVLDVSVGACWFSAYIFGCLVCCDADVLFWFWL